MRLFVALRPPAAIREGLADLMEGVACARWQDDDRLHLTLRFLGEVDRRQAEDLAAALDQVHAPAPVVALSGVGRFADSLWAALAPAEALAALHRKVDHACVRAGFAPERRAYLPHVTLARFARSAGGEPALARWLQAHAALTSPTFALPHLILCRSTLGHGGATYDSLARWPLGTERTMAGSLA